MTDLTVKANENFFSLMIIKYPHLNTLKLDNNMLSYADYTIDLKNFRLINFNKNALSFSLSAYDFFNLVKIHVDIAEEHNYIKNEEYNENIIYLQIESIVVKSTMNENDKKILDNFIKAYKSLLSYQDYLIDNAIIKLNKMSNLIYSLINNPFISQTEGIKLLSNINNDDSLSSSKGPKLVLNNSNFPSTIKDEDDHFLPKTSTGGYASIMLLLYIVINIGFILAVIFIK